MLKVVYSFFLGLLLAVFVGMGVATFYQAPKAPEYPVVLETGKNPDEYTAEQRAADDSYQAAYRDYMESADDYDRNVAIVVLAAAVVLVVFGLALHAKTDVIADGLLLGGTFTLLYSIIRSFATDDPKYTFLVASAGLIITMVVGYYKFIKPSQLHKPKRPAVK